MLHARITDGMGEFVGQLDIRNDGTGDRESGNYDFTISRQVGTGKNGVLRYETGRVEGFPRIELNAWDLVYRCLLEVGLPERSP